MKLTTHLIEKGKVVKTFFQNLEYKPDSKIFAYEEKFNEKKIQSPKKSKTNIWKNSKQNT